MGGCHLQLEPVWKDLQSGCLVDFLADTLFWDPNGLHHMVQSVVNKQVIQVEGSMPQSFAYTILQAEWIEQHPVCRIRFVESTRVIPHNVPTSSDLAGVVELCSGLGIMSEGLQTAGATIHAKNDLRPKFVSHQREHGFSNMIQGDMGSHDVCSQVMNSHPVTAMYVAGFSCQPWSLLGDGKKLQDGRSASLHHVLRCAFFARAHSVLLECVSEAGRDPNVQSTLKQWCAVTGFRKQQINLYLEDLWPSKRQRWWCLLTLPAFSPSQLRPLPKLPDAPTVKDLMPVFPCWPEDHMEHLLLGSYETNKFLEFHGFYPSFIRLDHPLATALHGWGNQLDPCPCECRSHPLNYQRLSSKGIFGAILPIKGSMKSDFGDVPTTRHIHPWELSVLTGVIPQQWKPEELKFGICGLGQMAAPLQAAWMYAQFRFHLGKQGFMTVSDSPEQVLWHHAGKVFEAYQASFPQLFDHPQIQSFVERLRGVLVGNHHQQCIPRHPDAPHGVSTQDSFIGMTSPPPATSLLGVDSKPHVIDRWCASCSALDDGVEEEVHQDALTHDGYADPEWQCPYHDCCICQPELEILMPSFELEQPSSSEPSVVEAISPSGGITAFMTQKRSAQQSPDCSPSAKRLRIEPQADLPQTTQVQNMPEESPQMPKPLEENRLVENMGLQVNPDQDNPDELSENIRIVLLFDFLRATTPFVTRLKPSTSVGDIIKAEKACGMQSHDVKITDAVGTFVTWDTLPSPMQQLYLHDMTVYKQHTCAEISGPVWSFDPWQPIERIRVLHQQEAWVASDEMQFYLTTFATTGQAAAYPPFVDAKSVFAPKFTIDFHTWVQDTLENNSVDAILVSAVLCQNHWHPWVVMHTATGTVVLTTDQIHKSTPSNLPCTRVVVKLPQVFNADCGFQTLGAVTAIPSTTDLKLDGSPYCPDPVSVNSAIALRLAFENHLLCSDKAQVPVVAATMAFGGMLGDAPEVALQKLLIEHGVPGEVAASRATTVITHLGNSQVIQALRSSKPWATLKAVANHHTPKVQLVLPSELEVVIKERAQSGKPFGDRNRKDKRRENPPTPPVVLQAEDVTIPDGLFQQGDGQPVKQISLSSIGPTASGIVVVRASQAVPYLRLSQPLSGQGLALLVLDHSDPVCAGVGQVIRYPGRCERTGEPFIGTARLVQIGSSEVSRHTPKDQTKVEEVTTAVCRIVCFRDELDMPWDRFIGKPVKVVMETLGFDGQQEAKAVVDVWDRQFLTPKLERQQPKQSEVFMVCIRFADTDVASLMSKSGTQGVYIEPRSQDGRSPSADFRVVWMTKMDRATVVTAQQTTPVWSCLVRSGNRYGLRTTCAEAQTLHEAHKPSTPYLDSNNLVHYTVGPFPFGANRSSLSKVFAQWSWQARPLQPRGKSSDGCGIVWEVQAANPPPYEVYNMAHSDVLISEIPKKKQQGRTQPDIVASAKTLAALRTGIASTQPNPQSGGDPFELLDPWASYTPITKQAKTTPVAPTSHTPSLDFVNASVDRKVAAVMAQVDRKLADTDLHMVGPMDERVDSLETRLMTLEQAVQAQHSQQQQYQSQVSQQFTQMHRQIESQGTHLECYMDRKMSEQLQQIEQLLGKKARHE